MQQLSAQQANAEIPVNENFAMVASAAIYARQPTTTGLYWYYEGGRWCGLSVPDSGVNLNASASNYISVNRSSGAVSVSTTTDHWNNPRTHARAYLVYTSSTAVSSYEDHRAGALGVQAPPPALQFIERVLTADNTAPTAGVNKAKWRMPAAMVLTDVRASLVVAQASGTLVTLDVNASGASIFSTRITIDNTALTSVGATTPCVLSTTSLADDAEMSIDIDAVGAATAARGLKVMLIGYFV